MERVQETLEGFLPELRDLEKKKVFTKARGSIFAIKNLQANRMVHTNSPSYKKLSSGAQPLRPPSSAKAAMRRTGSRTSSTRGGWSSCASSVPPS
jgi:hypothetical protein